MKKLRVISALLAFLFVLALLPTSVLASAASALLAAAAQPSEEDALLELLDTNGVRVGLYETLDEADAALCDGYTLRFLRDVTLSEGFTFGAARPKFEKTTKAEGSTYTKLSKNQPISYTVDGNGHMIFFAPEKANESLYALTFGIDCHADVATLKALTVVSPAGCVKIDLGTDGEGFVTLENCRLYAGNTYGSVDPSLYTDDYPAGKGYGVYQVSPKANVKITGADTVIWAFSSAVRSTGTLAIHDGEFLSVDDIYGTVYQYGVDPNSVAANLSGSDAKSHCFIYGGLFVTEKSNSSLVRTGHGARAFIIDGKFVDSKGTYAVCAGHNYVTDEYKEDVSHSAYAYIFGGEYYDVGHTVAASADGYLLMMGGTIYNSGNNGGTSQHNATSVDGTVLATEELATPVTITAPSLFTRTRTQTHTYTWGKTFHRAAGDFDVAVKDAAGNVVTYFDLVPRTVDGQTVEPDALWGGMTATLTDGVISNKTKTRSNAFYDLFALSLYAVPEGGTWQLLRDVSHKVQNPDASTKNLARALFDAGTLHVRMTAPKAGATDDPNTLTNEAAYTLSIDHEGYYMWYASSANVTAQDINFYNPTGRGIELANGADITPQSFTVGKGATVHAADGSCFYLGIQSSLVVENGGVLLMGESNTGYMVQSLAGCHVTVKNGARLEVQNSSGVFFSSICSPTYESREAENNSLVYYYVHLPTDGSITLEEGAVLRHVAGNPWNFLHSDGVCSLNLSPMADVTFGGKALPAREAVTAVAEVLDEQGQRVALLNTPDEAVHYLKDGYTLKMLKDYPFTRTLLLTTTDISWKLDGNGKTLGNANDFASYDGYVLALGGFGSRVLVQDLTVLSAHGGIGIYGSSRDGLNEITLHNVKVQVGNGRALYQDEPNIAFVQITGEDTEFSNTGKDLLYNRGFLDIYAGSFTSTGSGNLLVSCYDASETHDSELNYSTATVYGGTFRHLGTGSVLRSFGGGTVITVGGSFYADGGGHLLQMGDTTGDAGKAFAYIVGGQFFHKGTGTGLNYRSVTNASKNRLVLFGGEFYQQENVAMTTFSNTAFTSSYLTPDRGTYYGANVDPAAEKSGVSASTATGYPYEWRVTPKKSGTHLQVTAPLAGLTKSFDISMVEAAFHTVGNGGGVYLTADALTYTPLERNFYKNETEGHISRATYGTAAGHCHPVAFAYSFGSQEGKNYTLNVQNDGFYFLWQYGGTLTVDNIHIKASGRVLELVAISNRHGHSVCHIAAGATLTGGAECAVYTQNKAQLYIDGGTLELTGGGAAALKPWGGAVYMNSGTVSCTSGQSAIRTYSDWGNVAVYIKGGSLKGGTVTLSPINIESNCCLFWQGGTLANAQSSPTAFYIYATNGYIELSTSPVTGNISAAGILNLRAASHARIRGGTYTLEGSAAAFWSQSAHLGTLTIDSGTFKQTSTAKKSVVEQSNDSGSRIVINGGTYQNLAVGNGPQFSYDTTNQKDVEVSGWSLQLVHIFSGGTTTTAGRAPSWEINGGTFTILENNYISRHKSSNYGSVLNVKGAQHVTVNNCKVNAHWCRLGAEQLEGKWYPRNIKTPSGDNYYTFGGLFSSTGSTANSTWVFNGGNLAPGDMGGFYSSDGMADVTVNYLTFSSYGYGLQRFFHFESGSGNLTIHDGEFKAAEGCAITVRDSANDATDKINITINGGNFTSKTTGQRSFIMINAGATPVNFTINGGSFLMDAPDSANGHQTNYLIEQQSTASKLTINNGSFISKDIEDDAMISCENGVLTVNDGYFEGTGLCVIRVYAGNMGAATLTRSNAILQIKGGTFRMVDIDNTRQGEGRAVVRCGGGTGYGGVSISGGYFINDCDGTHGNDPRHVINMANCCSVVSITGGTMMARKDLFSNKTTSVFFRFEPISSDTNKKNNYNTLYGTSTPTITVNGVTVTSNVTANLHATPSTDATRVKEVTYLGYTYWAYTPKGSITGNAAMPKAVYSAASTNAGELITGAQVRLIKDSSGLRFTTFYDANTVKALEAELDKGGSLEYGTLIIPVNLLVNAAAFTHAALKTANAKVADVKADNGLVHDGAGGLYVRAAIINIKDYNYGREFAAIGYAKLTDAKGQVTYRYTAYSSADNSRSITYVTNRMFTDVMSTTDALNGYDGEYYTETAYTLSISGTTATLTARSGYLSPYTKSQFELALVYLGVKTVTYK